MQASQWDPEQKQQEMHQSTMHFITITQGDVGDILGYIQYEFSTEETINEEEIPVIYWHSPTFY